MAQQSKPNVNVIWAANGDVGTRPADIDLEEGWLGEKPPFQEMNYLQQLFNQFLKHVGEFGIAEWDEFTNYALNGLVIHNNVHYTSDSNDNQNNIPTVSGWTQVDFQPAVPPGSIFDWFGDYDNPPAGFAVCDGTNGTPDMRGIFAIGATAQTTGLYPNQSTGGAVDTNSTNSGSHLHIIADAGTHDHNIIVNNHTLTIDEMPNHSHGVGFESGTSRGSPDNPLGGVLQAPTTVNTESTGGGSGHNHTGTSVNAGNHNHDMQQVGDHAHSTNTLSPYLALVKIMKLAPV